MTQDVIAFTQNQREEVRDLHGVADALKAEQGSHMTTYLCVFRKTTHPRNKFDGQGYEEAKVSDTLNAFDNGETRTPILIVEEVWEENDAPV